MYFGGYLAYRLASMPRTRGPQIKRGWEILEGPYPKRFEDFIGQETAKLQIMAAIASAVKRSAPMDHVLLASGHPGIGKTTLGRLTASVLGVGFVELGGSVSDKDAARAVKEMQEGDVLFLDEIHRLVTYGKARAEWLLTLLQDGVIQSPTGAVEAPPLTVIGATTDAQKLPETILDRFPIKPVLQPYSRSEAVKIARTTAHRMGFGDMDDSGAIDLPMPAGERWLEKIAQAAGDNPRRMGQLLTAVRDIALSSSLSNLEGDEGYDIALALKWNGLTEDGLTKGAQEYLLALWANGGLVGVSTLKALLSEEQVGHTEKLLMQRGYMVVTPRGRELTDFGRERAFKLAQEAVAEHEARENA